MVLEDRHDIDCSFFSSRLSPFVVAYRAVLLPKDSRFNHPAVRVAVFAVLFRVGSAILAFIVNVVFPIYQREQFAMFGRTSPFWIRSRATTRRGTTTSREMDTTPRRRSQGGGATSRSSRYIRC